MKNVCFFIVLLGQLNAQVIEGPTIQEDGHTGLPFSVGDGVLFGVSSTGDQTELGVWSADTFRGLRPLNIDINSLTQLVNTSDNDLQNAIFSGDTPTPLSYDASTGILIAAAEFEAGEGSTTFGTVDVVFEQNTQNGSIRLIGPAYSSFSFDEQLGNLPMDYSVVQPSSESVEMLVDGFSIENPSDFLFRYYATADASEDLNIDYFRTANGIDTSKLIGGIEGVKGGVFWGHRPIYSTELQPALDIVNFVSNEQPVVMLPSFSSEAFLWSEDAGFINLGTFHGDSTLNEEIGIYQNQGASFINDIAVDPLVAVGTARDSIIFNTWYSYVWNQVDGFQIILPWSSATAISNSGDKVVGYVYQTTDERSYEIGGFVLDLVNDREINLETDLSALWSGVPLAISADGNTIGGSHFTTSFEGVDSESGASIVRLNNVEPYVWTTGRGVQSVAEWLSDADLPTDALDKYGAVSSISEDGTTLVLVAKEAVAAFLFGAGGVEDVTNTVTVDTFLEIEDEERFSVAAIARIPEPVPVEDEDGNGGEGGGDGNGGGVLEMDTNLTRSLFSGFNFYALTRQQPRLALNGAHHRLLLDSPVGENGWHTWATGDFARFDQLDSKQLNGEIGASRDFGIEGFRLGLGIGYSELDQDLFLGGKTDVHSNFALIEANYQLPDTSLILSALAYYGQSDASVTRGYLNAGLPDSSRGNTDIRSRALRVRLDWKDAYRKEKWSVSPRIAFSLIDTHTEGFTEVGGGFPVAYEAQDSLDKEIRIGADIEYSYNERTQFTALLELVKRFEEDTHISGTVLGVGGFNYPIESLNSTWGRLGFEVDHELTENQNIRASVFGSTSEAEATFSGALSYNLSF